MILALLVWCYISLICLAWGHALLSAAGNNVFSLPVLLLTGLCATGVLAFGLSILLPIGLCVHLLVLVPALGYWLFRRRALADVIRRFFTGFQWPLLILLPACLLVLLLINASPVIHPDTLYYHAQSVKWMETYKAVPGIVYLTRELGLQSNWFALLALYRLDFIHPHSFLFANGCVMAWLYLFILKQISELLYPSPGTARSTAITGWFLLFIISSACWTQVRLTAASASPDFIAALLTWSCFYLFWKSRGNKAPFSYLLLSVIFGSMAVVMKISAIPVLLLPALLVLQQLRQKKWTTAALFIAIPMFLLILLMIRNSIASGYPLFPTNYLQSLVRQTERPSSTYLLQFRHYITAYARAAVEAPLAEKYFAMPFSRWVPIWWRHLAITDQAMIGGLLLLLALFLVKLRKNLATTDSYWLIIGGISCIGIATWFFSAPDPRFGVGFIIPLGALLFLPMANRILKGLVSDRPFYLCIGGISLVLLVYSTYRITRFSDYRQVLIPAGVEMPPYKKVFCKGIEVSLIPAEARSGMAPVPVITDCDSLFLRGQTIEAGFTGSRP